MKAVTANIIFIGAQLMFAVWLLSFLSGRPPLWLHIVTVFATILFIWRIEKRDK